MNLIERISNYFSWEIIWQDNFEWSIRNYDRYGITPDYYTTEWCTFKITRKGNKHKLIKTGYNPEEHPSYPEVFKMYRGVVEGTIEIKGGEFYETEDE